MTTIRTSRLAFLLAASALLACAAPHLRAQEPAPQGPAADPDPGNETYQGESPDRYAMVRALDGIVHIRKGDVQEELSKGTPIAEGDVVESSGRGVLQLGDGTRVAFADATRFTVANLFTSQDGRRQVLLRLDVGRLRVHMVGDKDARIRIDTASGTVVCSDRGTFSVEAESDRTVRVSAEDGHLEVSNERDRVSLGAGERLTMFGAQDRLDRVREFNTSSRDDFEAWSDAAWQVRRGESWEHVPSEIRYYADDLDQYGSWVYSDEYGWVWKPSGTAADWRPYCDGRWAAYPGGMTWVGVEPWAYACYHHGRWAWSAGFGWTWIPGVYYSPAWVAWNYSDGYCAWAPLGYYNYPCSWGYGAWGGGYCWNVVPVFRINLWNVRGSCIYDRGIIGRFGTGGTGWAPGRGLTPPWQTRPLIATPGEFRGGQIQRAFEPTVSRERMASYQRSAAVTGRPVLWRSTPAGSAPANPGRPGSTMTQPVRVPFETRRIDTNTVQNPRGNGERPMPGRSFPTQQNPGQNPVAGRGERFQPQPRPEQRLERSEPPAERVPAERPTRDFDREDRRPEPQPREYQPRESRPAREYERPSEAPRGGGENRGSAPSRGGGGESRASAPSRGGGESRGSSGSSRSGGGSDHRGR